jgi:hypothetical protein
MCTLSDGIFSVADGGQTRTNAHIKTYEHTKASKTVTANQSISFLVDEPLELQLNCRKKSNSLVTLRDIEFQCEQLIARQKLLPTNCFDGIFTSGVTKSTEFVQISFLFCEIKSFERISLVSLLNEKIKSEQNCVETCKSVRNNKKLLA